MYPVLRIFSFFSSKRNLISCKPKLSFDLIYNLEAVAFCPMIFMGLALVHFQKYGLLMRIHLVRILEKVQRYSLSANLFNYNSLSAKNLH